jgi:hypothetical protein
VLRDLRVVSGEANLVGIKPQIGGKGDIAIVVVFHRRLAKILG